MTSPACVRSWAGKTDPTVVVGHSYGGQIMTALGADAPNAVALVYIAAFGLDEGESIGGLLRPGPADTGAGEPRDRQSGLAWVPEDDFVNHFAGDIDPSKARVMYAVQQPLSASHAGRRDGRAGLEAVTHLVPGGGRR